MSKKNREGTSVSIRVVDGRASLRVGSSLVADAALENGEPPTWMKRAARLFGENPPATSAEAKRTIRGIRVGAI